MQFYQLTRNVDSLPCSEVIRDGMLDQRCSSCQAALTWERGKALTLEYDREDDELDLLKVDYQYLIVRVDLCNALLNAQVAGIQTCGVKVRPRADDYEEALVKLTDVDKQKQLWRSLYRPSLFTVDFMKAGVVRVFDVDYTTIMKRPVSDRDVCAHCGCILDRELLYSLLERKVMIDTTKWNGADCFAVDHLGVVCTQKVVDTLTEASARGWTAKLIESITC